MMPVLSGIPDQRWAITGPDSRSVSRPGTEPRYVWMSHRAGGDWAFGHELFPERPDAPLLPFGTGSR